MNHGWKRGSGGTWLLAGALLLLPQRGFGQAIYGSVFGTVTDSTGAAIPGAAVIVTDTDKGTSVTLESNGSGEFGSDHLIPDTYDVRVALPGFKTFQQSGIHVFADTTIKVLAALEVGGAAETVNVSADSVPQLKTERSDVSTTFTSHEIVDLPLPGRNFTSLQLLLPGAQALGWTHAADENPQGSQQIEVDGQSFSGVAYELDGTDNEDPILGIIVINPNLDSLSETKITTQNYDAEFGKAVSSVITAQTKSGTNGFHGSAFDYRTSNANLARDAFSQGSGQLSATNPFPAGLKSQFGGSLGGPILKDRLFFFTDYQGVRQKVGIAHVQTVPSAQLVSSCLGQTTSASGIAGCDFSQYAAALAVPQLIYHTVNGVTTPFPNNVIPAALVSPQAKALLTVLQPYAPNTGGSLSGLKNNYAGSGTGIFNSDEWDARGDWTATQNTHVFARFSRFTNTLTGGTIFGAAGGAGFGLGGFGGSSTGANDSLAAGADIALSPKLVTDVRLGYFRYDIANQKYDQGTPFANQLGIPGLNTGAPITSGAPLFNIAEVGSFGPSSNPQEDGPEYGSGGNANQCNCPLTEREDQFQIVNNWTRTLGNHSAKFGADLRYARNLRVPSDSPRTGSLSFGTGPTSDGASGTGLGFATFALGDVTSFARYVSTSTNAKEFQKRDFFYAQDTWHPTSNLTLNYGLRYELYFPESVNGVGNGSLLNLDTGYLQVAGYGNIKSNMNYGIPKNTYNPRIGVAYQVSPVTVLRAGYGRSFDLGAFGSIFGEAATQNLPILANQSLTAPGGDTSTDTAAAFSLGSGPPAYSGVPVPSDGLLPNPGASVSSKARPSPLRLPTLDAWNLSLQQSITPTLSLTIAYVGNKGTHTLGDSVGDTTNPNEAAIALPSQYSVTGQALHYDPSVSATTTAGGYAGVAADGGTSSQTLLSRYYGGTLPACSDAAYTGTRAPNGGCGWTQAISYFGDDLDTHYNALQVSATKQMSHGYSLNVNYAWQKAFSEATSYATWNRAAVRGNDSSLRQQQVVGYGLFQLPFGRNKQFLSHTNGVINQIVSGIEISPVVNYSGGLPFSLCASNYQSWVPSDAPCYVNGNPKALVKHVTGLPGNNLSYYDPVVLGTGQFTQPRLDQIGNTGKNTAFGPRFFNTDLSIHKNFTVREKYAVQLRADGFNAFNHVNYGTPDNYIDQGGSISGGAYPNGSSNPRQLMFAGRLQF